MKMVNGKLLGQPKSELDIFKEEQNRHNLTIQTSLHQLTQKIDTAENLLEDESFQRVQPCIRELEQRCDRLERAQRKLRKTKQPMNHKLLWLTFASSLSFGIMSFFIWLDIYPVQRSLEQAEYSFKHFAQLNKSNN